MSDELFARLHLESMERLAREERGGITALPDKEVTVYPMMEYYFHRCAEEGKTVFFENSAAGWFGYPLVSFISGRKWYAGLWPVTAEDIGWL